jgi:hypothetical protein
MVDSRKQSKVNGVVYVYFHNLNKITITPTVDLKWLFLFRRLVAIAREKKIKEKGKVLFLNCGSFVTFVKNLTICIVHILFIFSVTEYTQAPIWENHIKGIVQPKKKGVKRGTIGTVMTSHTIADSFLVHLKGYSFVLNRKKLITALRAKKTWSPFLRHLRYQKLKSVLWRCATFTGRGSENKKQPISVSKSRFPANDSPCGGTSKAATVAVMTRGVLLLIWKNIIICFHL